MLLLAPRLSAQEPLRIGLLLPGADTPPEVAAAARMGAELGAEEAQRLSQLLGRQLELVTARAEDAEATVEAGRRLITDDGVFALVGGFDTATCTALGELAEREDVIFFNVGCTADELRRERCWQHTFHVAASDAMRRDALQILEPKEESASSELWHASLYRYGATQLNDRFRERFDAPMSSHSWASWLAVKTLAESALRARSTQAAELAAHLVSERTKFDGHKGRSLSFRRWDHQLRQPLYMLVSEGEERTLAGEAPSGRPAPEQTTEAFLDQLGDPPAAVQCRRAFDAAGRS